MMLYILIKQYKMAIYSGFSTRKLEDKYNKLISETISLLSQIIITYVERNKLVPFQKPIEKLYQQLSKLDELKHADPKYSQYLKPLSCHINLVEEVESVISHPHEKCRRRPLTSNHSNQSRRLSLDYERKTINTMPPNPDHTNKQTLFVKKQRYENSGQEASYVGATQPIGLSMEELMEKNRLVEKKMSMFRKKKYLQQNRISKIQELDEEDHQAQFC